MTDPIDSENEQRKQGPRSPIDADPAVATPISTETARPRRVPLAAMVGVGLVALVAGIGGTLLTLRYTGGQARAVSPDAPAASGEHTEHQVAPAPDSIAPDTASGERKAVYISPARQQLIGVRTATVEHRSLDTTIRTVGTLAYDETRVTMIHTKIPGWIERVYVDYVGKAVRRGEALFTVYSPDLVSTQKEYLLALRSLEQLGTSQFPETRAGAESLAAATRERLKLWDITDAQIAELERSREPRKNVTLYSPFNGVVLERSALAGQYITPETTTFKVADLSTIWVIGQIFEYEMAMVKVGQPAEVAFPYGQASRNLKGRITYIYPDVDPTTRRARVRIEFSNPGLEFKPESFVTVLIRTSGGQQLAIPKEAVIDTGVRRYALLALPNGYFEPREIEVGEPVDEFYPVLNGLAHGDRVVTSAQFLIDSETNLQAAMQSMAGHGHATGGEGGREGTPTPKQPAPASKPGAGHEGMDMPAKPATPPKKPGGQ